MSYETTLILLTTVLSFAITTLLITESVTVLSFMLTFMTVFAAFVGFYKCMNPSEEKNVYKYDPYDEDDRLHMQLYRSRR